MQTRLSNLNTNPEKTYKPMCPMWTFMYIHCETQCCNPLDSDIEIVTFSHVNSLSCLRPPQYGQMML